MFHLLIHICCSMKLTINFKLTRFQTLNVRLRLEVVPTMMMLRWVQVTTFMISFPTSMLKDAWRNAKKTRKLAVLVSLLIF